MDTALDNLEKSVDYCIAFDNTSSGFQHSSVLVNKIIFNKEETSQGYEGTRSSYMLHQLENEQYNPIRDTEQFKIIIEKLKNTIKPNL